MLVHSVRRWLRPVDLATAQELDFIKVELSAKACVASLRDACVAANIFVRNELHGLGNHALQRIGLAKLTSWAKTRAFSLQTPPGEQIKIDCREKKEKERKTMVEFKD